MKIIIVGLGQTGTLLARRIAAEGHDTVVIDCDKERVEAVTNLYNVSGVCGSGASKEILLQAGAATAVLGDSGADMPGTVPEVYLDRPFLYMLVDTETSLPAFIGVVTDMS